MQVHPEWNEPGFSLQISHHDRTRSTDDRIAAAIGLYGKHRTLPLINGYLYLVQGDQEVARSMNALRYDRRRTHEAAVATRQAVGATLVDKLVRFKQGDDTLTLHMAGVMWQLAKDLEADARVLNTWEQTIPGMIVNALPQDEEEE